MGNTEHDLRSAAGSDEAGRGSPPERFSSFEAFWPYYVGEHLDPTCRLLHYIGTGGGLVLLAAALLLRRPRLLLVAATFGYGFAWIGHFFIEGNRPATFRYPLYSLRGDLRMLLWALQGRMGSEARRVAEAARGAGAP